MRACKLLLVVAALLPAVQVVAATSNAVLWGNVYDANGKPAPGVTIVLDNPSIAFQRTTVTGPDGSYTIFEVPPAGGYRVTAIKDNERWDVRLGIVVNVGDDLVVIPPLHQQSTAVASRSGMKASTGASTDTIATSVSGVVKGEQLHELPLFNRNFLSLGLLTPNTHDVEPGSSLAGASFSVSGVRPIGNNFLLDGVENVATSTNQAVPFQVNDSIQEFRVITATANAQFGRTLGGTVNVVTRRASNTFHGSVFGYFASDVLNARSPVSVYNGTTFDKAAAYAGDPKSNFGGAFPLTYNDYVSSAELNNLCTDSIVGNPLPGTIGCGNYVIGGSDSGPVFGAFGKNTRFDPAALLARFDSHKQPFNSQQFGVNLSGAPLSNRLFLFGSYEGTRIDNPTSIFERVPSTFDRTYNPLAAAGVQWLNVIPSGGVVLGPVAPPAFAPTDPNYTTALRVLNLFPRSNVVGVPGVLEFYRGEAPNYTHVNNMLLRADLVPSVQSTLSLRYAVQHLDQLHDDTLPTQPQYPGNGALRASLNQNVTIGYTRNLSTRSVSESRIGFSRFNLRERPQDQGLNVESTIGLPFPLLPAVLLNGIDPQYSGASTGPLGAFGAWIDCCGQVVSGTTQGPTLDYKFPFARIGAPLTAPSQTVDSSLFLAQTFTLTRGKHNLHIGGDYQRNANSYFDGSFARGLIYSGNLGEFTSNSEGCKSGCAEFFGPNAFANPTFDFAQRTPTPYLGHFTWNVIAGFAQDTWRVRRTITLNLGLRYEYFSPPAESNGNIWNWDPTALGVVQQGHTTVFSPFGLDCVPDSTFVYPAQPVADQPPLIVQPCSSKGRAQFIRPDYRNFGPRVGVAWDVFGTGKTVLRTAAGWFYDPVPVRLIEQLVYNRPLTGPNGFAGTAFPVTSPFVGTGTGPCLNVQCAVGNSILVPSVQQQNSLNTAFPNSVYSLVQQPFAVYAIDSLHSRTSYARQISVSVQQQVTGKFVAEADYVGNTDGRLPVIYNANFGNEFNIPIVGVLRPSLLGPELSLYPVFTETNRARADYHALVLQGRVGQWHGLQFHASYTWSKSLDNQASANFPVVPITANNFNLGYLNQFSPTFTCLYQNRNCGLAPLIFPTIDFSLAAVTTTGQRAVQTTAYNIPQNPFTFLKDDWGRSDFDVRHRSVAEFTWNVPRTYKSGLAGALTRGWLLSGIVTAQTGQPYTIFIGPILNEVTQRASSTGQVRTTSNSAQAIDASAVAFPPCPRFGPGLTPVPTPTPVANVFMAAPNTPCTGNTGRNQFTGPSYASVDVAVQKNFHIGSEQRVLTFRVEAFNLFNRANFYNPISVLSLDGFNSNPDFGKIKSAHDPRQLQLAGRFSW